MLLKAGIGNGKMKWEFENGKLFRHGLMLLWYKELMNVTEKLQFKDPTFQHSCQVPSSGVI